MRLLFQQTYSLLLIPMTPNCANTISKHGQGCEGIFPQGKGLHNSQKLRKVVAIYKTDKLILSK